MTEKRNKNWAQDILIDFEKRVLEKEDLRVKIWGLKRLQKHLKTKSSIKSLIYLEGALLLITVLLISGYFINWLGLHLVIIGVVGFLAVMVLNILVSELNYKKIKQEFLNENEPYGDILNLLMSKDLDWLIKENTSPETIHYLFLIQKQGFLSNKKEYLKETLEKRNLTNFEILHLLYETAIKNERAVSKEMWLNQLKKV